MTVNYLGLQSWSLRNFEHPFIGITSGFTLIQDPLCLLWFYQGKNRCWTVELFMLENTWNHLTVCQKMSFTIFKNDTTNHLIEIIFKQDLVLNNNHELVRGAFNKFPDFFVQAFQIVLDSGTFTMLLLCMLWNDRPIYDFRFKWTATAGIRIHPTKIWLLQLVNFNNAIWTWGHFRRTICNKIVL